MKKNELEIRLKIAEKSISHALEVLSTENINKQKEKNEFKDDYFMNVVSSYATACGRATALLEEYYIKCKDIDKYGIDLYDF